MITKNVWHGNGTLNTGKNFVRNNSFLQSHIQLVLAKIGLARIAGFTQPLLSAILSLHSCYAPPLHSQTAVGAKPKIGAALILFPIDGGKPKKENVKVLNA